MTILGVKDINKSILDMLFNIVFRALESFCDRAI